MRTGTLITLQKFNKPESDAFIGDVLENEVPRFSSGFDSKFMLMLENGRLLTGGLIFQLELADALGAKKPAHSGHDPHPAKPGGLRELDGGDEVRQLIGCVHGRCICQKIFCPIKFLSVALNCLND